MKLQQDIIYKMKYLIKVLILKVNIICNNLKRQVKMMIVKCQEKFI